MAITQANTNQRRRGERNMALKIAVMGSGGVGGFFGARLAQAGADVTFVARGSHLAAMRANGLRIDSKTNATHIQPVKTAEHAAEAGTVDVVMFCVKMADTDSAAQQIKPLVERGATVFTFQNGVESADRVGAIVGPENVVAGTAQIAAVISEPGVIKHTGTMARMVFGEPDGKPSPRTEAFLAACKAAGFDCVLSDDITRAVWMKFAMLAPFSGMTTLTRGSIGPVRTNAQSRRLLEAAVREVVAVGAKLGKHVTPEDAERTLKLIDGMPAEMTASMTHDLLAGKPLELNGLSGAVARLGEANGIPVPTHRFIADALSVHIDGRKA
jgi:2-dehydropantoate 2-reductase